jgi:hypothetical protein
VTDTNNRDEGKPGTAKGVRDVEDLKARLGLASKVERPAQTTAAPPKKVDEFSLSLGVTPTAEPTPQLSAKELAEIETQGERAVRPLGRTMLLGSFVVLLALFGLFLGYQYGRNNSERAIQNSRVDEAQRIRDALFGQFEEVAGDLKVTRQQLTDEFRNQVRTFVEGRMGVYQAWKEDFAKGQFPEDLDLKGLVTGDLAELKGFTLRFQRNVGTLDANRILQGQVYSFDIAMAVLDFGLKAERLRMAADNLRVSIEALEQFAVMEEPLNLGAAQEYVLATKLEAEANELNTVAPYVQLVGDPAAVTLRDEEPVYQQVSVALEYDCLDDKGRPAKCELTVADYDGKPLLVKADEVSVTEKTEVRQRVRNIATKEETTAKAEYLFLVDFETKFSPVISWSETIRKLEVRNFEVTFDAFLMNLEACRAAADDIDFENIETLVREASERDKAFVL